MSIRFKHPFKGFSPTLFGFPTIGIAITLSTLSLSGQDKSLPDTSRVIGMPQIEVIGYKEDRLFRNIPGVAHMVRSGDLKAMVPISGNEVFHKVPGLHIVDEEGAGLRVNIGIRGLDPDRSRNVLILEDGIPVALNPYGEPEMYFTPLIDRMQGIEVLKGSGQLLFGPQTIGGVINYISVDPPEEQSQTVRIRAGQNGYFSGYFSQGNSTGPFGYLMSYTHKRADHLGSTEFRIHDLSLKIKMRLSDKSSAGMKVGMYDEQSNSTYVGITQTMYDRGGQDFVRLAPDDILPVRRYHLSMTHLQEWNHKLQLRTTVFGYTTTRNWRRQEFGYSAATPNQTGVIWGDTTVEDGALYMRDRTSWRNRQFEVVGAETKLTFRHNFLHQENSLQTGVRGLLESAEEQFIQGNTQDAYGGNMRDNEKRTGLAFSYYAVNEMKITDQLSANVGIRMEHFNYEREIRRGRFTIGGVSNVVRDTSLSSNNTTLAFLPGAGINFLIHEKIALFAGVHRGFAPPRTKDAITAEGEALDIEKELSTNYEAGARFSLGSFISFNTSFFYLDFQNQIIPTSQSSGQQNATGLTNGGRTRHVGIEADIQLDLGQAMGLRHSLIVGSTLTTVHSQYAASRFIDTGEEIVDIRHNRLPYAPALLMNHYLGMVLQSGWGVHFYGNYTSAQFTDELNTVLPSAHGLTGRIAARYIVDGTVQYTFRNKKISVMASCKNLTDERYIASRRPQGIKVGLPRFFTVGMDLKF